MRRRRVSTCLLGLVLLCASPGLVHADGADPDRLRSEGMVGAYGRVDTWVVKALALTHLGSRWHPRASGIVLDALTHKDARLRAYGLEALRRLQRNDLRVVLTAPLLEELVRRQVVKGSKVLRSRTHELLGRAFPAAAVERRGRWAAWWRAQRATYAPPAWAERSPAGESDEAAGHAPGGTVTRRSIVERALELTQTDLQLVIVLDTTGSMQSTIDAACRGLVDLVTILGGMAPRLEVGLVQYRDVADLGGSAGDGGGAQLLESLTRDVRSVLKRLNSLSAGGGGDFPERVEGGLWHALDKSMGWSKDASKMVVIIGDAPPHPTALPSALEQAKRAHRQPEELFAKGRRGRAPVVTGRGANEGTRSDVRPFHVSCVGVGPGGAVPATATAFRRIAAAGGGVYAGMATNGDPRAISTRLVSRLVESSFGEHYVESARRFVAIYFDYAAAGYPMR